MIEEAPFEFNNYIHDNRYKGILQAHSYSNKPKSTFKDRFHEVHKEIRTKLNYEYKPE